jgi:hypothetical protein
MIVLVHDPEPDLERSGRIVEAEVRCLAQAAGEYEYEGRENTHVIPPGIGTAIIDRFVYIAFL